VAILFYQTTQKLKGIFKPNLLSKGTFQAKTRSLMGILEQNTLPNEDFRLKHASQRGFSLKTRFLTRISA